MTRILARHLYHYFKGSSLPLRSLTELPLEHSLQLARTLRGSDVLAASRFDEAELYIKRRRRVEQRLWNRFVALGGKPDRKQPFYFVVGRSRSFFERFEKDVRWARLELDSVAPELVSFTYGDSLNNALIADESWPHPEPCLKPWHGCVYTRAGIERLVADIGAPQMWKPGRDHYVEAQVWATPDSTDLEFGSVS